VLQCADVFVFPSLFEGMPMALIEALTAGLPIVASDIPANREAVADAGILVAGSSVTDVVDAVREIIERPEVARRLSARARSRSEAFSATSMVNGYLELCS
jgi:glycosyltransferase involved in cell wall biosynthesis